MLRLIVVICALGFALPAHANSNATNAVNALRQAKGVPPVSYSAKLEAAALKHAKDMSRRGFFSHRGSNGSKVSQRVKAQGYKWCFVAENISKGEQTLNGAIRQWANSRGHYKNMMNRQARHIGLARAPGNIWVMVLAKPCRR